MMEYRDYYKVLGVERKSESEGIKRAYRKLVLKYHPDVNQGDKKAEEKLKDLNEAYAVLSDMNKRARYDQLGEAYNRWRQNGGTGKFNWDAWVSKPAPTTAPEPPKTSDVKPPEIEVIEPAAEPQPSHNSSSATAGNGSTGTSNGSGFSDFFNYIFGSSRPAGHKIGHHHIDHPIRISLAEVFTGTERTIQVEGRLIKVKIPPGSRTGTRIRMANAGPVGRDGRKVDLFLVVNLFPDEKFEIKGVDLHTEINLDLLTAVLGGEVDVPTPTGTVVLTIPAGTQPGQTFRLAGRGLPLLKEPQEHGNLYVQMKIQIPRQITTKERSLYEKLRNSK